MNMNNILETIGNTPLVKINHLNKGQAIVMAKLDFFNPSLSAKDRAAYQMIQDALDNELINKDTVLIEPTSGNTGIGLAMVAAVYGMQLWVVMPDSMSIERRKAIAGYGAKLVLTSGKLGMQGAVDKANELHQEMPNSWIPQQFANPSNPLAHYKTTAVELEKQTAGKIDAFVAGVGTGGTISGVGKYFKEKKPDVKIFAVEPSGSPILNGGQAGPHKIQGIGANFIPDIYDSSVIDEVIDISDKEAIETARQAMKQEGMAVGISSGASLAAALQLSKRPEFNGKTIVAFLPDSAARYLSTDLFNEEEEK